jgi:hypothetical protein
MGNATEKSTTKPSNEKDGKDEEGESSEYSEYFGDFENFENAAPRFKRFERHRAPTTSKTAFQSHSHAVEQEIATTQAELSVDDPERYISLDEKQENADVDVEWLSLEYHRKRAICHESMEVDFANHTDYTQKVWDANVESAKVAYHACLLAEEKVDKGKMDEGVRKRYIILMHQYSRCLTNHASDLSSCQHDVSDTVREKTLHDSKECLEKELVDMNKQLEIIGKPTFTPELHKNLLGKQLNAMNKQHSPKH